MCAHIIVVMYTYVFVYIQMYHIRCLQSRIRMSYLTHSHVFFFPAVNISEVTSETFEDTDPVL